MLEVILPLLLVITGADYAAFGLFAAVFKIPTTLCWAVVGGVLRRHLFIDPPKDEWRHPGNPLTPQSGKLDAAVWLLSRGGQTPSTAGLTWTRLRRRARWVRALETVMGGRNGNVGSFLAGWWTPDLPGYDGYDVLNYVLGSVENGVRCLGGGIEKVEEGREADGVYLIIDSGHDEVEVLFPQLLAKLRQYALYRERDVQLLGSLRTRAGEWCRAVGLANHVSDLAIASATSMAMIPSTHERLASARVERACSFPPLTPSL